jgi:hypothetical protein
MGVGPHREAHRFTHEKIKRRDNIGERNRPAELARERSIFATQARNPTVRTACALKDGRLVERVAAASNVDGRGGIVSESRGEVDRWGYWLLHLLAMGA